MGWHQILITTIHLPPWMIIYLSVPESNHKCRCEITKNTKHQSDWSKVSLYPSPSFLSKNRLLRRFQIVWHQWLYQPWPHLWISHLRVTGPYVQLEPCSTTYTRPQIIGRIRSWSLSPSRKALTETFHLPPSLDRRPSPCIRSKPMM